MKLILTEKPSVAVDIARSLGTFNREDGYLKAGDYIVTWALGHLLEIDDSAVPRKWRTEDLPLFPEFRYRVIRSGSKQFNIIKELLQKADSVIIATDAGREGELIARLILMHAGWKEWNRTYRLWTSEALTPDVVRRELNNLKPAKEFDSLYYSALARQHSDWIVGINLTRLVSLKSSDGSVWSVGRVQTPTLKLIVDRDTEIENFKPQPYWVIKALFNKEGDLYEGWLLVGDVPEDIGEEEGEESGEEDRNFRLSKDKALLILKELGGERQGEIISVNRQKKKEKPPLLHSLTSLQREANRLYGLSAKRTLDIAQRLYQDLKVISYPRTDARHLGSSNKELVKKILQKLGKEELIGKVDIAGKRVFDDSKLTDHHAIIPLAPLPPNVSADEKKIYDLILRKFIGAFMSDYEYETTTVVTRLGRYRFITKGKRDINLGWKVLYQDKEKKEDKLPKLHEGYKVLKVRVSGEERKTKPPPRYTEAALLKVMERLGLGTPATRADIINTLLERGYVVRKSKSLMSTPKGKELISKLRDSRVSSPEMTAEWEKELETIYTQKKGKSGYERFLEGIKRFVKDEIGNIKSREFTAPKQATKKMLDLAKSLARETGLKVPKETDFETIKNFIDKALKEKEKQLAEGLGKCMCGGKIIPFKKGWRCESCRATVWHTMFGKKMSKSLAIRLLKGERVYVKGLRSKNGKRYSAYLRIENGKVKPEFSA